MKNGFSWIIERRWAIIITTLIMAVLSCLCLPRLHVDADFFNYLPADDPVVENFNRLTAGFSHDSVMVVVESDRLFSREGMQAVWDLSQEIGKIKGLASITSLANVASINAAEGGIEIGALLNKEALNRDEAFYASLKERVLNDAHYRGVLISDDGRFTTIVINLAQEAQPDQVAREIRRVAAQNKGITKVHFAGTPMMMSTIENILWGDMQVLIPLVVLLLVVVLYLSFKRLLGVWLPLAAVGLATLMVVAIMAFCGVSMTMISAILPIILLSNGSAYGIHVLSAIRQRQAQNPAADNNEIIFAALKKVALPVSLAALTTLVGFLSFISSPLSLFKEFGVEAGIGIVFSLVLALVFVPAVVSLFPPKKVAVAAAEPAAPGKIHWLDRLLGGLANFVEKHYRAIVLVTVAVMLLAIPGMLRLQSGLDMMGFFARDSEIKVADNIMNDHFGGSQPVFVSIRSATVKNPLVLQKIHEITKEMRVNPHLQQVNSVSAIVAELNYHIDQVELIPQSQEAIGNLWLMVDGNESLAQMVAKDGKSAMIVGRTSLLSTEITKQLIRDIDSYFQKDNQLVALPLALVTAEQQEKLAQLRAREIAHQLALDSRYYQPESPFDEAVAATEILAAIKGPAVVLAAADKQRLAADYFNSFDCDLVVEDAAARERLISLALKVAEPEAAAIEEKWLDGMTELAQSDPDGLSMAAGSLADIFARGAKDKKVEQLLTALVARGFLQNMPLLMAREVKGDLFRLHQDSWAVTPGQYLEFTGQAAPAEQQVTMAVAQTGMHVVTAALADKLTESQISSLLLSLIMVFLALLLQLRSFKNSVLALLPVLFTITFMFGLMGYTGISIDILTALIASLAVGIGVDYSIHISFAINRAAKSGASFTERLSQSINGSGQAILINASAVVAGFLVIVASQMPVLRLFGGLVALAIGVSALGALTIIPAVYMLINKK